MVLVSSLIGPPSPVEYAQDTPYGQGKHVGSSRSSLAVSSFVMAYPFALDKIVLDGKN